MDFCGNGEIRSHADYNHFCKRKSRGPSKVRLEFFVAGEKSGIELKLLDWQPVVWSRGDMSSNPRLAAGELEVIK